MPSSSVLASRPAFLYLKLLYCNSRPYYVVIERRPTVFGYKDWLDEETNLVDVVPEKFGDFQFAVTISRHDNGNVNVAVRIGVAFTVGAEHHDLWLYGKAGGL